jgi:kynurenine formamidase
MCLPGTIEAVRESEPQLSRRTVLAGSGAAALAALLPGEAVAHKRRQRRGRGGGGKVVDLTHTFRAGFPVYTGNPPSKRTLTTIAEDGFYKQEWTFDEHSGTHMDAPGHFVAGGRFTDQLKASELVLPIVVIDISKRAASNPDAEVTADDLKKFEKRHGKIPKDALVAMNSGWAAKVGDDAAFKGGPPGAYHFPGFNLSAIEYLLDKRRGSAIGVDTMSLDFGRSATFDVHKTWLPADNYGIENLANLHKIPPHGATAIVGVIPWHKGSGGPARVLATY